MQMHAAIVGIDKYSDRSIGELSFARRDAETLASRLRSSSLSRDMNVRVLVDGEATRSQIVKTIGTELARVVKPEDVALIYFACHGSPEISGSNAVSRYLICHDTDYSSL